jgi:leucyl-tRNA synthetase
VTIIFQVNGKVRGTAVVAKDLEKGEILALAKADENVQKFLEGKTIVKEIIVPNKIVNFVVK